MSVHYLTILHALLFFILICGELVGVEPHHAIGLLPLLVKLDHGVVLWLAVCLKESTGCIVVYP